jgi:DnaJ homolog subfamily C member 9
LYGIGSEEEVADLRAAYLESEGDMDHILSHIAHSSHADELRFEMILTGLITKGELTSFPAWEKGLKDVKTKLARKKAGEKEAQEAERMAKELGVWDEFYGSGKTGKRKTKEKSNGKGKGKGKAEDEGEGDEEGDESVLKALIQRKASKTDSFLDGLAAKYGGSSEQPSSKKRGKKRDAEETDSPPKKKTKLPPPELDDEAFEKLQKEMFGEKVAGKAGGEAPPKRKRAKRK